MCCEVMDVINEELRNEESIKRSQSKGEGQKERKQTDVDVGVDVTCRGRCVYLVHEEPSSIIIYRQEVAV